MDDLRLVENGAMEGKICAHSAFLYSRDDILAEKFLAPEQLDITRHKNGTVDLSRLPTLDEKIDIYKIPAITNYILGSVQGHESLKERLRPIHAACSKRDRSKRPSATVVKNAYTKIYNKL